MMHTLNDVHEQFATYFQAGALKPYLYLLSKKMSEGHVCIDPENIDLEELPEHYQSSFAAWKGDFALTGSENNDRHPFIFHKGKLYFQRYFRYETQLLERIAALVAEGKGRAAERSTHLQAQRDYIQQLFPSANLNRPHWQLAAAIRAVMNNFTIITGGPGTGKTSTVARILSLLLHQNPDLNIALAAPTGKAAARMAESLQNTALPQTTSVQEKFKALKPSTLHRLLGWQKGSPYFKHHAKNLLPYDVLVVDEASMIDLALFAKLLSAVAPHSRLILLGDKDQLASVEAGSLLDDLCQSLPQLNDFNEEQTAQINSFTQAQLAQLPEPPAGAGQHFLSGNIAELRFSHRFSEQSAIGYISKAVIHNEQESLQSFVNLPQAGDVLFDTDYNPAILEQFAEGYTAFIKEKDPSRALDLLNRLRILCATREGEDGIYQVNQKVEHYLSRKGLIKKEQAFYRNRPVMVTENNYSLGLFNGDIGILREDEQGTMKAWFPDSEAQESNGVKSVLPGFIGQIETVYAMTIHKSQGSEFDKVLVVLPRKSGNFTITRELLYTAITRARKQVSIQCTREALLQAAENKVARGSGVTARLKDYG